VAGCCSVWLNEFLASYFGYAFLAERRPERKPVIANRDVEDTWFLPCPRNVQKSVEGRAAVIERHFNDADILETHS
jgi:hypothetical protein